jgi:hypothetical protein
VVDLEVQHAAEGGDHGHFHALCLDAMTPRSRADVAALRLKTLRIMICSDFDILQAFDMFVELIDQ